MDILFRYVHFLGILLSVGALMSEALFVKEKMNGLELRKMALLDAAFGMGSMVFIAAGLLLWFKGGKPSFFYSRNPVFMAKITLVGVVALLSIYPTIFFVRNRKLPEGQVVDVPGSVRRLLRAEIALVMLVPLLAVLMARGIGLG